MHQNAMSLHAANEVTGEQHAKDFQPRTGEGEVTIRQEVLGRLQNSKNTADNLQLLCLVLASEGLRLRFAKSSNVSFSQGSSETFQVCCAKEW